MKPLMTNLLLASLLCNARLQAEEPAVKFKPITATRQLVREVSTPVPEPEPLQTPLPSDDSDKVQSGHEPCGCDYCTGASGQWWQGKILSWLQASHWGYCEYFDERPFGSLAVANMETQVYNGRVAQQVLYHYDFGGWGESGGDLNARGKVQLLKIAQLAMQTGQPIVIQRTRNNTHLDEMRRESVVQQIGRLDVGISSDLVKLTRVPILGLGAAGERNILGARKWNITYGGRLEQTLNRGSITLLPNIGGR